MLRHWFAHPLFLPLLAALPVLAVLAFWSGRRRRKLLARLGSSPLLEGARRGGRGRHRLRGLLLALGLTCLLLGSAGPQWGRDWEQAAARGRDLVVAFDCSRSMLAETPSRLERARAALLDLARTLEKQGGHRLALVTFAGQARVACPLTHDYDHFRSVVAALDPAEPAAGLAPPPGTASGTRIGLGLHQAVLAHDGRFPGARDILLLSDGDDPARDGEYRRGAAEARAQGIPVYAVGLGDPDRRSPVPGSEGPLRFDDQEVLSRLEEEPLREIADRTKGVYIPARTLALPLGAAYLDTVAGQAVREDSEDAVPVYRQRPEWLLAPALSLLILAMALPDRRPTGLSRWQESA